MLSTETYSLQLVSPWRYGVTLLSTTTAGVGLLIFSQQQEYVPDSKWIVSLLLAVVLALALYLTHRLSTAKVALTLDEEGIRQIWLQQFTFAHHPDTTIRWENIVDYKFEHTPRSYWFKATLRDGAVWRLYRNMYSLKKDDFFPFRDAFTAKVAQYNLLQTDKDTQIHLAKTFPQTRTALVLAVLMVGLMTAFPIVFIILDRHDSPATTPVGIFGAVVSFSSILFVYQVYMERKERREYEDES